LVTCHKRIASALARQARPLDLSCHLLAIGVLDADWDCLREAPPDAGRASRTGTLTISLADGVLTVALTRTLCRPNDSSNEPIGWSSRALKTLDLPLALVAGEDELLWRYDRASPKRDIAAEITATNTTPCVV
jgi:hypothetical protein